MPLTSRRALLQQATFLAGAAASARLWSQNAAPQAAPQSAPAPSVASMDAMRAAAAGAVITPQPLRGGVSLLRGPFGNILVLAQPEGALGVDSGLRAAQPQIQAALATLSPHTPATLIITHFHVDHTDGNEWMHARGAVITAHRLAAARLARSTVNAALRQETPAVPLAARPTDLFDDEAHKQLGAVHLTLTYLQPAHTDGDISVLFVEPDVVHIGDIWYNGFYPLIDYSNGGTIDGMIRAAQATLKRFSTSTLLVPGHGPVGTREQLQGWLDMLTGVREKVATLKRQGLSAGDVIASKPTAAYDGRFIARAIPTDVFVACVYATV